MTIPICEIFGPTIQGEGFHVGVPTVFVRTGGCDYSCVWCDTLYAVLPKYKNTWAKRTDEEILAEVKKLTDKPILITFSGGNPAIHNLESLIDLGHTQGYTFTMETQASIPQKWFDRLDYITLSPKPPSSLMKTNWDALEESINMVKDPSKVSIKVVVSDDRDYEYALSVFDKYPTYRHFITPCNTSPGLPDLEALYSKTREIIDRVLKEGRFDITVLPQLHVLLWGNERGK